MAQYTVTNPLRLFVTSGPRNISTALMYSFAQRADTRVYDEPLYAYYLRHTDAESYHPGAQDVLNSQSQNGEQVVKEVILGEAKKPVLFFKNMTHHLLGLDWSFLEKTCNVILIRDPRSVINSYAKEIEVPSMRDVGFADSAAVYNYLREKGEEPPVIDSREVLLDPRGVLTQLCERVGILFDENMLSWQAGARPEDGVWAKYWYDNVHKSTGFQPYRSKVDEPFPARLEPLLEECLPIYERLYAEAIRAG